MNNRHALIESFGEEIGTALFGSAIKVADRYGVDVDDVVGEMVIEALEVKAKYGFYHVNSIVNHTKNALARNAAYGVTMYYSEQGITEVHTENFDGEAKVQANAHLDSPWSNVDLSLDIQAQIEELGELEQGIARGFMAGLSNNEIAEKVTCHFSTVSKKKAELREAFAWAK